MDSFNVGALSRRGPDPRLNGSGQVAFRIRATFWNAFDWIAGELALDLVITVPENVALEIDDSSGSVELRNVGPTKVDDSSGSLQVSGVNGDLSVDDGSGTVTLRDIRG